MKRTSLWTRLRARFLPHEEWDEELESHLDMRREWLQAEHGLPAGEASASARRSFGSKLKWREAIRDLHLARWLEDELQDVRYALRSMRRTPWFALSVLTTIALAIGAATTVFSIVDPLLFRPLPFKNADRLVSLGLLGPIDTNEFAMGSMYLDWRDHQRVFTSLTAMRTGTQCDVELPQLEHVPCVAVERSFLPTLGVTPLLGRNFTADEDKPHGTNAIMISDRIWRSAFGSQPSVVGRLVQVDDKPARIVGVLPPNFVLPQGSDVDVILPAQFDEAIMRAPNATVFLRAFGRLKPGISLSLARSSMESLFRQTIDQEVPRELRRDVRPVIRSVRDRSIQEAKLAASLLVGAVALLLLLACLTVANMFLARVAARRDELSMRSMLGANRWRLVRQSLTETLVLCLPGGVLGCALGLVCIRFLVHFAPGGFRGFDKVQVNPRILLFSTGTTLVAALLSGLLPALVRPAGSILRSWQNTTPQRARLRQCLVAGQLACSLVLLSGAVLLARSLQKIEAQAIGFEGNRLTAISIDLPHGRYGKPERRNAFYRELETRLAQVPGVTECALSDSMPPSGGMHGRPLANLQIAQGRSLGKSGMVSFRYVTPSYFKTLRTPIVLGRAFTEPERSQPQGPLIVSEQLKRLLFGADNPLGKQVSLDGGTQWLQVIGVAKDVKNAGIEVQAWPEYYKLRTNDSDQLGTHVIALLRSDRDATSLEDAVRSQIRSLDPRVAFTIDRMEERTQRLSDRPRFLASVMSVFAATSLFLAGTGLYGIISFLGTARKRELGIRAALGATRGDILLLIQKQTLAWTCAALVLGLALSAVFAHLIRGLLFQVAPDDPFLLGSSALALLGIALVAGWRPTREAIRIDPAASLRVE